MSMLPLDTVLHGDAIAVLQDLPDNSVPMLFVDPPYGIGYHSNHYKDKNPHAPVMNDWNFQIGAFLAEARRVLCDGGALYLCCRWDVTPLWMPLMPSGLKVKTVIVWIKDNWSAGDLTGSFGNQYEQIIFAVKGRHTLRGKRWPNVWDFARVPASKLLHPTQKPVSLIERAILASTDPGDVVVDVFSGSGSTGEAARKTGRHFLLADVDKRMVGIASRRLGLPFDEDEPAPIVTPRVELDIPSPEEWGIHPEDLQALCTTLRRNVETISQPVLWTANAA